MISQWIMTNIDLIAVSILMVPLVCSVGIGFFLIIDDYCAEFRWYAKVMYGNAERDQELADEFFGKMFIGLGLADLIVPCIVIYGYLHITAKTFSDLWVMPMR